MHVAKHDLIEREVHRTQHVWVVLYQRNGVKGVVGNGYSCSFLLMWTLYIKNGDKNYIIRYGVDDIRDESRTPQWQMGIETGQVAICDHYF